MYLSFQPVISFFFRRLSAVLLTAADGPRPRVFCGSNVGTTDRTTD